MNNSKSSIENQFEQRAERLGRKFVAKPGRTTIGFGFKWFLILFVLAALCGGVAYVGGWFKEAGQVAQEETGPRALLKKYSWFKDTHASLAAKRSNLTQYESKKKALVAGYEGVPCAQWDRVDKQQLSQWDSEIAGLAASFNNLAAEYNANMAKVHWRFMNKGDLPAGETETLPREVAEYLVAD